MSFLFVQEQGNQLTGTPTTITATYNSVPTVSTRLLCGLTVKANDATHALVGWTKIVNISGNGHSMSMWFKTAGALEPSAVSPTWTAGAEAAIIIAEYSGGDNVAPLGETANASNGASVETISVGPTAALDSDDQLLWAVVCFNASNTTNHSFSSEPLTLKQVEISNNVGLVSGELIRSGDSSPAQTTCTWTEGRKAKIIIATFRAALVPPPPVEPGLPEYGQGRAAIGDPPVYGATIVRS